MCPTFPFFFLVLPLPPPPPPPPPQIKKKKKKNLFFLKDTYLFVILLLFFFPCCCQMVSMGRRRFGTDFQLMFRILKALLFLGFMSVMTVLFVVCGLSISDLFAAILAFTPTGWALVLVSFKFLFLK
jgi:hypothetical protein